MSEAPSFIVFSDDWGAHPSSTQHLFQRIARTHDTLWVNTVGLRPPRLEREEWPRVMRKLRTWTQPRTAAANPAYEHLRLRVVAPPMLPWMRPTSVRLLNRASVRRAVTRAARDMGLQNSVLVVTTPIGVDAAGVAGVRSLVYYCVDDFTRWPGVDSTMASIMERELIARADLILATSTHLATTRRAREVLPHGVDALHFARACDPATVPHPGVRRTNPVIGYLGLLDARFDVALVAAVARARPTWDWVLVGPTDGGVDARLVLPNVRIVPAVPYAALPTVLAAFDVAALPYVRNELTRAINPLKLREYLASGRPVVATSLPEVMRYVPEVRIADTVDDTLAAIEACLADTPTQRSMRMQRVADESWDALAARFVFLCQEVNTR